MKHNIKITIILVSMFVIAQLIGLFVISFYNSGNALPYGMEPPAETQAVSLAGGLSSILVSFVIAILLFFILTKIKADKFIKLWFFLISVLAIAIALNVLFFKLKFFYPSVVAFAVAVPLAYLEIFKKNIFLINFNKLFIYAGVGAVFVSFLVNLFKAQAVLGIIILLLLISIYDIWAVWHSGFMQKMAKYQINNLGIFGGFFIPYAGKKEKAKIRFLKEKYKNKSEKARTGAFKKAKIKINLAILGGGDVVFPIITAGIFYVIYGAMSYFIISVSALLGLFYLNLITKKGKFYPAMPFLTIGMYAGMIISWILSGLS